MYLLCLRDGQMLIFSYSVPPKMQCKYTKPKYEGNIIRRRVLVGLKLLLENKLGFLLL